MSRNPPESNARQRGWLAGGAIFLVTLVCYLPALRGGFIWDDDSMLTANPFVKLPLGLYYIWASTALPDYWPLTYSSFWLEWRIWGINPTGYHATNILLHAGSAVLLWRVLKRLSVPGAWFAALIFAVHPVTVQSVAWITERKNTLSLFFGLLAMLWYLRFDAESRHRKWYWLALLAFVLSLLAKTAPVMLPVVLVLYHWWRSQRKPGVNQPSPFNFQIVLRLAPFFLVSLLLGLATIWFQTNRAIGSEVVRTDSFGGRLAGAGWAVWFYLYKAFVPVNLSFAYPRWEINAASIFSWLPLVAVVALLVALCIFRRTWSRAALFGLGSFLLLLLPVLGFFNVYFQRYSLVADHWQYFALPGVVAVVGAGIGMIGNSWSGPRRIGGAVIVVMLAALTWKQTLIYANSETLWRDTLKKNPESLLALNNLGNLLMARGDVANAKMLHLRSLELNPNQIEAHNNLGEILLLEGRVAEAKAHYQRALEINPREAMTLYNIANILDREGKTAEAMATYRKALEIDPLHAAAHSNLGCLLYAAGRTSEAMDEFTKAIELQPGYADALNNLGAIFLEQGRFQQAESLLWQAISQRPDDADTWFNLGNAILAQSRSKEAALAYLRVIALNPRHALARCRAGTALWHAGDSKAARAELAEALRLQPDLAEAHQQTGLILAAEKQSAQALTHLRRAVELQPVWPEALAGLAFTLATAANEPDRNRDEALRLATRAVELSGRTNFIALDALAAAQAETAKFAEAARNAGAAVELAQSRGDTNRASQIRLRQKQYESNQPYRQ